MSREKKENKSTNYIKKILMKKDSNKTLTLKETKKESLASNISSYLNLIEGYNNFYTQIEKTKKEQSNNYSNNVSIVNASYSNVNLNNSANKDKDGKIKKGNYYKSSINEAEKNKTFFKFLIQKSYTEFKDFNVLSDNILGIENSNCNIFSESNIIANSHTRNKYDIKSTRIKYLNYIIQEMISCNVNSIEERNNKQYLINNNNNNYSNNTSYVNSINNNYMFVNLYLSLSRESFDISKCIDNSSISIKNTIKNNIISNKNMNNIKSVLNNTALFYLNSNCLSIKEMFKYLNNNSFNINSRNINNINNEKVGNKVSKFNTYNDEYNTLDNDNEDLQGLVLFEEELEIIENKLIFENELNIKINEQCFDKINKYKNNIDIKIVKEIEYEINSFENLMNKRNALKNKLNNIADFMKSFKAQKQSFDQFVSQNCIEENFVNNDNYIDTIKEDINDMPSEYSKINKSIQDPNQLNNNDYINNCDYNSSKNNSLSDISNNFIEKNNQIEYNRNINVYNNENSIISPIVFRKQSILNNSKLIMTENADIDNFVNNNVFEEDSKVICNDNFGINNANTILKSNDTINFSIKDCCKNLNKDYNKNHAKLNKLKTNNKHKNPFKYNMEEEFNKLKNDNIKITYTKEGYSMKNNKKEKVDSSIILKKNLNKYNDINKNRNINNKNKINSKHSKYNSAINNYLNYNNNINKNNNNNKININNNIDLHDNITIDSWF